MRQAYPSLLDPTSPQLLPGDLNFQITGNQPYLYFTQMNPAGPGTDNPQGLDRDLVRMAVQVFPRTLTNTHDFNADGRSDIVWYHGTNGQVVEWLVDGTSVIGGGSPGSASSPWAIVGQRDFNNDGFADLLWRTGTTGQLLSWFLNGSSMIGGGSPGSAASPWSVAGTGDFNGDGFGDVLWYNATTGQAVVWLLDGATVIGGGSPGSMPSP